jgi:hypothetical protein
VSGLASVSGLRLSLGPQSGHTSTIFRAIAGMFRIHRRNLLASDARGSLRPVRRAVPLTQPPLSEVYAIPKRAPPAALDTEMQETVGPLFGMAAPCKARLIERRKQVARKRVKHCLGEAPSNPLGLSAALQRREPAGARR